MEEKKIYLSFSKFKQYIDQGAKIIDTRNKDEYIKNHIEGSYNVQLEGNFEEQMEHLFTPQTAMVLICDRDTERTAVRRLQNIDFTENVLGYLYNGIEVYKDNMDQTKHPLQSFHNLNDNQFVEIYYLQNNNFENMEIVDLRPEYERNMNGFIQGSINVDVNELEKVVKLNTQYIDKNKIYYFYDKNGNYGVLAQSILANLGYTNTCYIGTYDQLEQTNLPIVYPKGKPQKKTF